MKISELPFGQTEVFKLRPVWQSLPDTISANTEVKLALLAGSEIILTPVQKESAGITMECESVSRTRRLESQLARGWPLICQVKSVREGAVVIEVHQFPARYEFPEPLQIGVSEQTVA